MGFLPGWNSVELSGTITHWLHISAIVVLGFLFLSEGMALVYDMRHEHLVGAAGIAAREAENALREQERRDREASDAARKAEVEALHAKLAESSQKLANLSPRHLTTDQIKIMIERFSQFKGSRYTISVSMGNSESKIFADDFEKVLRSAGWDGDLAFVMWSDAPVGVHVVVASITDPQKAPPPHVERVIETLGNLGIIPQRQVTVDPSQNVQELNLIIGTKPEGSGQ